MLLKSNRNEAKLGLTKRCFWLLVLSIMELVSNLLGEKKRNESKEENSSYHGTTSRDVKQGMDHYKIPVSFLST